MTTSVIVGGSRGLGRFIAERFVERGDDVIVTSRSAEQANKVATELGGRARGLPLDLSQPTSIANALADIADVDNLVITATASPPNTLRDFSISDAITAVTVKLVGYTETVRVLHDRLTENAAVVIFGGVAIDRPYPGSTMVTAHNGGISALARTLAIEIAPHRVNAIHPGIVGDSPRWRDLPDHPALSRTPTGRLATMADVADATEFLLRNAAINAQDLNLSGGVLAT